MKTQKKIILVISSAAIMLTCLFFACKKSEPSSSNSVPPSPSVSQSGNPSARSVGTQTFYSRDTNGVYYKMILAWSSGVVTVDRSIVSSYPVGTVTYYGIEDGITCTKINPNTDSTTCDTLKVSFSPNKKYYAISFIPNSSGGYEQFEVVAGGGGGGSYSCQCDGSWGTNCKITGPAGKFYCSGCQRCYMCKGGISGSLIGGLDANYVKNAGFRLVEASNITIAH